jgi:hypothetical protein
MTFGFTAASIDTGIKLASWQFFFGGTHSYEEYADYNAFKPAFCACAATLPTCWTAVPLDFAKRAYYADKTWPIEFRRNYKSPLSALI